MNRRELSKSIIATALLPVGLIGGTVERVIAGEWSSPFMPWYGTTYEWRDGTLWMHFWNDIKKCMDKVVLRRE